MLYLRTGANGSCKTLFTLKDVREMQLKELRPVCYNGRFKIKPAKQAEFGWKLIDFKDWQAEPDGTIFLMDECHLDLPKRPNGSAVPPYVSKLAEHRARGFDFFLLTQHPSNIDSFVTKLIGSPGWHQHLKRAFGASNMTSVLQWSAVNNTCEKDGSGRSAQVTMRAQPKEVFDWYDSAELHTGKRKIPKQFWMVVVGVPVALSFMFMAGKLMWDRTHKVPAAVEGSAAAAGGAPGSAGGARDRASTPAEYVDSYRPRIAGFMHTAPAYDKLTEPKRVPIPAACVEMKTVGCKCYTQDATPYPVELQICRQLVAHGSFFAFQPEGERRMPDAATMPRQQPEQGPGAAGALVVLGGTGNSPGAPTEVVAAFPAPAMQPRVQPGTKWSFQPGG